ncbi:C-terminal domain of CinA type S [Mucinivorans hirudinis]|uniref:CinA-like protein n=1 Tax=Mucinivorans hirudinis TaxID=1433126 RepID=A0A060RDR4_9BACT|nr:C-terminal domain of CinA type S [Mucinivorans hirudinis]
MNAEIITIGDEILIGQIVDTNSAWIGALFSQNGITVSRVVSVSDRVEEIIEAIDSAIKRADVVVVTGGLGPTKDDITKSAIARYFGVDLVRDYATFEHVRSMMEARGIEFNESNQAQALVPSGCEVLKNENGSAPGMLLRRNGRLLFSLPGVPFEMKALVCEKVLPLVRREFSLQSVVHRTVVTFGMAESILSETIAPWEEALPEWLRLAYLPNARGIRLRLSAYDVDKEVANAEMELQFRALREIIEPYYIGDEPVSVEAALATLLCERGETLAVAESCTGGLISSRITQLEGASKYFLGSVTAYDNDVKEGVLGVCSAYLRCYGAVSQQVAEQMAQGVRMLMNADYAIATTGVAGPGGGSEDKPVGTVWIAIAWRGGVESRLMRFGLLRDQNIERSATHALNMLRLHIIGASSWLQNSSVL